MNKNLSFNKYRLIDVLIFTAIACLTEYLLSLASGWAILQKFSISLILPVALIMMVRWNYLAVIPVIASSAIYVVSNHGSWQNYLIYIIGNLFILINILWFIGGKEKLKKTGYLLGYITTGYLLIELGRSFMGFLMLESVNFFELFVNFLIADIISLILALFIVFISSKQAGLFEDQKQYLTKLKEEEYKQKYSIDDSI
ncbi:MAG: hypothetical protein K6G38_05060 [Gammaproteobacteria bacterium]|nr:hypothetical protein [Gammaproteobacteria bacterium]